ncbi:MAG: histidine kinase [Acidimicrobiales bacterium]
MGRAHFKVKMTNEHPEHETAEHDDQYGLPYAVDDQPVASIEDAQRLRQPRPWRSRSLLRGTGDGANQREPTRHGLANERRDDRVAAFRPAVLAIRWGTAAVSLALAIPSFLAPAWITVALCLALFVYTVVRTVYPIRYTDEIRGSVLIFTEVAFHVAAIVATGKWESPFVFSLLTAVIVAGFARGFVFALRIGGVAGGSISLAAIFGKNASEVDLLNAVQWTIILLLVALVAGYSRRISGEADRQRTLALDRLERLSDANALLFSLHRIAQTLPASLDMAEVLDTTMARLRSLFDFDAVVLLLFDDTDAMWQVLRREGVSGPSRLGPTELPAPLMRAMALSRLVHVDDLHNAGGPGLASGSRSGLYSVLEARGSVIGLLAIEHRDPNHFTEREIELLDGFIDPVALAVDNARWFGRLRTVGADEERTRIARDLHDRIGQSLAYLAFELDRLVAKDERGEPLAEALTKLQGDTRMVIGEVRDTLYDLRTDVSDSADLVETLEAFSDRIRARSDLEITITSQDNGKRLPIRQEREMWRIAQEALVNIERHAEASAALIHWRCDGERAELTVVDDGKGFPIGAGRVDSYGIMGMRERASSIGATLEIVSEPGEGASLTCALTPADQQGKGRPASIAALK